MEFPINDQLWSIVPNLNRLKSLIVSSYADTFQSQLQTLLDRTPNLHTLTIHQDASLSLQMSLFTCTNTSVRRLNLHSSKHCFNKEECITLSYSSLGIQCEVLSSKVNNRESIINLVKNLIHLQILYVYWNDQNNVEQFQLTKNNDELVQWLKDQLPSACLVINDSYCNYHISIWV
ncbi:unnamed protein product [Rotaria sordida]|uniref:Uncharacterized protein n=2 Tax=Rotaria sordida TaxID=392033 RepID=A0A813ZCZ4_9BILA|nr:unnamed protein product [Rotaria sordida]